MSRLAIRLLALELIVALVAIGTAWHSRHTPEALRQNALRQLAEFNRALHAYMADNGGAPPALSQGLQALFARPVDPPFPRNWRGPYMSGTLPLDPWGDSYVYHSPGPNGEDYLVTSYAEGISSKTDITSEDAANR